MSYRAWNLRRIRSRGSTNSRIQSIAKRKAMLREHGINSYTPAEEEEEEKSDDEDEEESAPRIVYVEE